MRASVPIRADLLFTTTFEEIFWFGLNAFGNNAAETQRNKEQADDSVWTRADAVYEGVRLRCAEAAEA